MSEKEKIIVALQKHNPNISRKDIEGRLDQLEKEKEYWKKQEEKAQKFADEMANQYTEKTKYDVDVIR